MRIQDNLLSIADDLTCQTRYLHLIGASKDLATVTITSVPKT